MKALSLNNAKKVLAKAKVDQEKEKRLSRSGYHQQILNKKLRQAFLNDLDCEF
jgi:hypothetical protein